MIAALVWKEYREHRTTWLVMAGINLLALFFVGQVADGAAGIGVRDSVAGTAVLLSWAYGILCGALLLAGEREDGTLEFLDGMPRLRRQVWSSKCVTGLALVLAQAALAGMDMVLFSPVRQGIWPTAVAASAAVLGLGWGLLFSAYRPSVLPTVGLAAGVQILAGGGLLFLVFLGALLAASTPLASPELNFGLLGLAAMFLTILPFVGSHKVFCEPDVQRLPAAAMAARRPALGWRPLLWLSWRQALPLALAVPAVGLVLGLLVLLDGAIMWPIATLLLGVLCGVTTFADEQALGSFRFLGDQRFPPGRVWLIKTAMRLGLAAAGILVALVPSAVRGMMNGFAADSNQPMPLARLFHDALLGLVTPTSTFLIVWVLYGFAIGQLCGMLVRKTLAAAVLGIGAAAVSAMVWVPSLAAGGLKLWQIAGPPILALAAARLLFPAWTAGRLLARSTVKGLALAAVLAILWVAGALAYRAVEVPYCPDPPGLADFVASLPAPQDNEAGRLIREGLQSLGSTLRQQNSRRPTRPLFADDRREARELFFINQASEVLDRGWPPNEPELTSWLEAVCAGTWVRNLAEAARLPVGVVADMRRLTNENPFSPSESAREAAVLLCADGLRGQAAGSDATFVKRLREAMALARNLRNHAVAVSLSRARSVEAETYKALDRWLEKLQDRPNLLREALHELRRHETERVDDAMDTVLAEFVVARNTLVEPEGTLQFFSNGESRDVRAVRAAAVGLAWRLPWEQERLHRLLRQAQANPQSAHFMPGISPIFWGPRRGLAERLEESARAGRTQLRSAILKTALRLYQAEKGRPAATLNALVPDYLVAVSTDPYSGRPFRYRLSAGENIEWPDDNTPAGAAGMVIGRTAQRFVPRGQGILWSVGPDGEDGGGRVQFSELGRPAEHSDQIFLVPLPAKPDAAE
jgi:hypothetical protein